MIFQTLHQRSMGIKVKKKKKTELLEIILKNLCTLTVATFVDEAHWKL